MTIPSTEFQGFSSQALSFLSELRDNNSREWFEDNRGRYERYLIDPARRFVTALGKRLSLMAPHIHAEPKVNRAIFRIHRDTRFSKNKEPYKTNLGLWFWEGRLGRMECPGFYFHLEPERLMLGFGIYQFSKPLLKTYRSRVSQDGPRLVRILTALREADYNIGGKTYKRLPAGYQAAPEAAELLLHSGLYAGCDGPVPEEAHSEKLVEWGFRRYHRGIDLHRWLLEMTEVT